MYVNSSLSLSLSFSSCIRISILHGVVAHRIVAHDRTHRNVFETCVEQLQHAVVEALGLCVGKPSIICRLSSKICPASPCTDAQVLRPILWLLSESRDCWLPRLAVYESDVADLFCFPGRGSSLNEQ